MTSNPTPKVFLAKLAAAIDAEHHAELAECDDLLTRCTPKQLQDAGLALINLKIAATRTGLGGKCLLDLDPAVPGVLSLPPHKLRNGDIVALETHDSATFSPASRTAQAADGKGAAAWGGISGVVFRVTDAKITLVCDEDPTDDLNGGSKVRVVKLVNEISHKRLSGVIKSLQSLVEDGKALPTRLMDVLLNGAAPQFDEGVARANSAGAGKGGAKKGKAGASAVSSIKWFNPDLNSSQQAAVELALAAQDISLIHGPPGTGKTHTLIEIIRHLVSQNLRILVCGPSNISVDNIVERLAPHRLPMLRIGHPARLLPTVLAHSLDVRVRTCDEGQLVSDIVREMDQLHGNARKAKSRSERRGIYDEIKVLRKELKQREAAVVRNLIRGAKVVLTTLNGAGGKKLDKEEFDVVVIDECAQALEPECWLALLKSRRAILAGDHLQLPPTIKSAASSNPLCTTLFERLINRPDGADLSRLLNVQYRMHTDIMTYPSTHLYKSQLVAHDSVATHTLVDVANVNDTDDTRHVLLLVDTAGADMWESVPETDGSKSVVLAESKCNEHEADIAAAHVRALVVDGGLSPKETVVLTPYNAQVALIKSKLRAMDGTWAADVEVGSVDGMQGREKDAVVLSLVRSNDEREVGFLAEERRLNVAVTRARRHLCVICDSETVAASKFCKGLVEFMTEHGELRYPGY